MPPQAFENMGRGQCRQIHQQDQRRPLQQRRSEPRRLRDRVRRLRLSVAPSQLRPMLGALLEVQLESGMVYRRPIAAPKLLPARGHRGRRRREALLPADAVCEQHLLDRTRRRFANRFRRVGVLHHRRARHRTRGAQSRLSQRRGLALDGHRRADGGGCVRRRRYHRPRLRVDHLPRHR